MWASMGRTLMVPMPYLQRQLLPNSACATPPCTAPSVYFSGNPAFQSDISQISGTASVGSMNYNALQAVFQKRYSSGLQYQVAYTFSRCRTDNSGYYGNWGAQAAPANPYYQNLYDPKADWADCFFDAKNVLSAYAIYDIPFGRGKRFGHDMNRAVDAIAGGWSIAPIVSIHSGFPLALYDFGTDTTGTNSRGLRPDCGAGAGRVFGRQASFDPNGEYLGYQWFDPTPYSAPASGTFGNCPAQGPVRGPGYGDVDLSIQKNFPFTETMKLQFRTDFLNAFNRVNLNTPATALGDTIGSGQHFFRPKSHPILSEVLLLIWLVLWGRCSPTSAPFLCSDYVTRFLLWHWSRWLRHSGKPQSQCLPVTSHPARSAPSSSLKPVIAKRRCRRSNEHPRESPTNL